jgi:hypothetical protein
MKTIVLIASAGAALALIAAPAAAKSKHHRHYVARSAPYAYASQPQIACTVAGCIPIPRNCYPEMGYTPDGTPTGFDVAVCGGGAYTLYGNRR